MTALAAAALFFAVIPAVLFCFNLRLYRSPPLAPPGTRPSVSVLIPARNEEASIAAAVASILASEDAEIEVVVMDDASTDGTAEIVRGMAADDPRLRLATAPPLPPGWNGKQHACWSLANAARYDLLCFVDADVRVAPTAIARMAHFRATSSSALVSGFPREITATWIEQLLIPLIHFVLMGFLPISRMRAGTDTALAAGCGQFLMVERSAYFASGGHAAIRATMHDGLLLPRLLRRYGYRTDLADITALATCRMYHNAAEVWQGLAKNATEGIAAPARIVPITLLLLAGQVLPFALAILLMVQHRVMSFAGACAGMAVVAAWLPRLLAVRRFRQPLIGAVLHPAGVLLLLAVQWYALLRKLRGGAVSWRSRTYSGSA
jgi:cellulose synthase/poly-beta-1,6-N-acetylglucosamine synthase-like glycosyltransferase